MKNKILLGAGLSACALAWAAKDPVILTVNGIDVPKSEFEYLYHKNSQQQLSPQPLKEYVEMFKIYKMKVADAKAAGIDTTAGFIKEMAQYRKELASPYMNDSTFFTKLVEEAVERGKEEVETSHIMMMKTRSGAENRKLRQRLDSIRTEILNGADFGEMAMRYSQDRSAATNKGNLGWLVANRYPYAFEMAAYATPEGTVSEIVESPAGYHIIKTGKRRPAQGKVQASHIMKMARKGATPEEMARAKEQIDSIYAIVKADPSKFAEIAKADSDDKGSAVNGGQLPWFGPGEMVPEFEAAAFALEDGQVSEPVQSMDGWHIILKTGKRGAPGFEEVKADLQRRVASPQDGRMPLIRKDQSARLAAKHKARMENAALEGMKRYVREHNGLDSTFVAAYSVAPLANTTIAVIDGKKLPASKYVTMLGKTSIADAEDAVDAIENSTDVWFYNQLTEAEEDWLYANNADYRNLLNEYRDGSLLYEISVQKVWDKAAKDKEGLEKYFNDHRSEYAWTSPRVKGILVQAANDSVAGVVKSRMDALPADSVMPQIRKEFKGKVQLERVLVEKGANPMVDNLMFDGPAVKPNSPAFTTYFLFEPRVLTAPEEVGDVRGQVTSDYQNELEAGWIQEMKSRYPVKVNEKELKKVK